MESPLLPFGGCRHCDRQCQYRDRITPLAYDLRSGRRFQQALWKYEKQRIAGEEATAWLAIAEVCQRAVERGGLGKDPHATYCYFTHLWSYESTEVMANRLREVVGGQ